MVNEWEVKKEICEMGRRMYINGYVAANDGNISYRMGNGRYLCTPTGVSKGFLKPADIAVVDDKGKQLEGPLPRTSEVLLHLEIFHELPEVNAVCHAHPPHATAFAVSGIQIPTGILPEVEIFIGQVPLADYETPGSKNFAETVLPHLKNKANTILLANHGAVACDKSLLQAYFHLETLDMYCKILLLSKQVGNINRLPVPKIKELLDIKSNMGIEDPRLECTTEQCILAGSDEFMKGFSSSPIPQHSAGPDGHGRGLGIEGEPSQKGEPQPMPEATGMGTSMAAGRILPGTGKPGESSSTAQLRAQEDEIERVVQLVTDQILGG